MGQPDREATSRPRRKWRDNIKLDIQEVRCGVLEWIELAKDSNRWRALVNAMLKLRVPSNAGKFLPSCMPVGFSRTVLHGVSK